MGVDFNIKYKNHPRWKSGEMEVSDDLEQIIQEIELCLFTQIGTVIGEEDFGAGLETYMYKLNVNPKKLKGIVTSTLNKEIPELTSKYSYEVDVKVENMIADAIGIIEIKLFDSAKSFKQAELQAIFS